MFPPVVAGARGGARHVLAIPRNVDDKPIGGIEVFGSVTGSVANDGAFHALTEPAGVPPLTVSPRFRLRIKRVRVEWQTPDTSSPPPLVLQVQVNGGAVNIGANSLTFLPLQSFEVGSPAVELAVYLLVPPGATVAVFCKNTGVVNPQIVSASLVGYTWAENLPEGAGYAD